MLHTGAKIQLGGLKLGLTNVGYQVTIAARVTIPEKYPITRQVTTTVNIRVILFILCFYNVGSNLIKSFYRLNTKTNKRINKKKVSLLKFYT